MAGVGDRRSKVSNFGCSGCGWQDNFISKISGSSLRFATLARRLHSSARIWKKEGKLRLPNIMPSGMMRKVHEDVCKDDGQVQVVD